jgi:hypothetical protein
MVHITPVDGSTESHSLLNDVSVVTNVDIWLNMASTDFFVRRCSTVVYRVMKLFRGVQNVQIINYAKTMNMPLTWN